MTRASTQATEAESYWRLAEEMDLYRRYFPEASRPFDRATTEQFAMDSYQVRISFNKQL